MGIWKLYLSSIILNFLPIVVMFLAIGVNNIHGEMTLGFYIYGAFFVASSIINLSFFLLKIKFIRDNKVTNFLAHYASSLLFLIVALYLFNITSFWSRMFDFKEFLLDTTYFFINFLLVFLYRNVPRMAQI